MNQVVSICDTVIYLQKIIYKFNYCLYLFFYEVFLISFVVFDLNYDSIFVLLVCKHNLHSFSFFWSILQYTIVLFNFLVYLHAMKTILTYIIKVVFKLNFLIFFVKGHLKIVF